MIGFKASHDPRRLLTNCKVIDGHICFHQKEAYPLYELFKTRYRWVHVLPFHYGVSCCCALPERLLSISHALSAHTRLIPPAPTT